MPLRTWLALFALLVLAARADADWSLEVVDGGRRFEHGSTAFSPAGQPAVAYGGGHLYYAHFDGAAWVVETVDPTPCVGSFASLAFDAAGEPAIAYHDTGAGNVRLARHGASGWSLETVASVGFGRGLGLAFAPGGEPAICYFDEDLLFARQAGAQWTVEVVDATRETGQYVGFRRECALEFAAAGTPGIAYTRPSVANHYYSGLGYAHFDGVQWQLEAADPTLGSGSFPSLAFDGTGEPAISYAAVGSEVRLARRSGAAWSSARVDGVSNTKPSTTSLVIDLAGNPAVAYFNGPDQQRANLKLARWTGSAWSSQVVDVVAWYRDAEVGLLSPSFAALAIDASGRFSVAYLDHAGEEIEVALGSGTIWERHRVDSGTSLGNYASLALDAAEFPAVAHYDSIADDLRFTARDGTGWTTSVIDSIGDVGRFASLAFDASGDPRIGYRDVSRGDLKLARGGPGWQIDTVDSSGDVGESAALALDRAGNPLIAYQEIGVDLALLWLNRFDGATWNKTLVDGRPRSGYGAAIALDGGDQPFISYTYVDPVLVNTMIGRVYRAGPIDDVSGSFAPPLRLAVDPNGVPAVSQWYAASNRSGLRFTVWDGVRWQSEIVHELPGYHWVRSHDLKFERNGRPVIATPAGDRDVLLYLRREGPGWSQEVIDAATAPRTRFVSLALTAADRPVVAYQHECLGALVVATPAGPAVLHRAAVPATTPGWKDARLPLTAANDDEIAPFPLVIGVPGASDDPSPPADPVVLYRVLWPDGRPARNSLRLVKQGGLVRVEY